jgi:ribonuclease-3
MHRKLKGLTPSIEQRVSAVEAIVGHSFTEPSLIRQALTHPSAVEADPRHSYERLEFLGDAIVDLIVAEEAFRRFGDINEGTLTKIRISVVNGAVLTDLATGLGLDRLIIFGQSEKSSQHRGIRSASEDVFEALVGALYLDGGLEVARRWVLSCLGDYITLDAVKAAASPKSELQELMQAQGRTVRYRVVASTGPAHAPSFTSEVLIDGQSEAIGSGETKKQAEAAAAAVVLARMID